jgi:hypothetical protein
MADWRRDGEPWGLAVTTLIFGTVAVLWQLEGMTGLWGRWGAV